MNTKCYAPQKGIDDVIASLIAGWNPYRVATLRGMYDELHETKPLDVTNLLEAAKKLVEFRKKLMQDRATKMKTAVTTASKDYLKLSEDFEGEILSDRINMISHIFSNILDSIEASYITNRTDGSPILTRLMIVNGFTNTSGQLIGGQFAIFESIYNMLMERYEKLIAANLLEMASKYKKIFNNWPALVLRVRVNLREIEGIKLGNKWEYAVNADPEAFEEEALTESYFAEEATRESWMEKSEQKSMKSTLSLEIKRFLARIPSGTMDDLGFKQYINPTTALNILLETVKGFTTEKELLLFIKKGEKHHAWMKNLSETLELPENWKSFPEKRAQYEKAILLRTALFVNLRRNFLPYTMLLEQVKNGIVSFKTKLLNKIGNASIYDAFITRLSLGKQLSKETSVYNKNGTINWTNLLKIRSLVKEYFTTNPENIFDNIPKFFLKSKTSEAEQLEILNRIINSLGINSDSETLIMIVANSRDLRKLVNYIKDLVTYGFDGILTKKEIASLEQGGVMPEILYKTLIDDSSKETTIFKEKLSGISKLLSKYRETARMQSRVLYKDKNGKKASFSSYIIPNYMGDKIAKIQSFVAALDTEGFKKYLELEFFNTSYFKSGDTIFNRWLKDLYESDLTDENSFASNFDYNRFLGDEDNNFENFTERKHLQTLLAKFVADREISNKKITYLNKDVFKKLKESTKEKEPDFWKKAIKGEFFYINGTNSAYRYNERKKTWEESTKNDYAEFQVFVLGDSGVAKFLKARRYSKEEIREDFYALYKQEKRRMALTKAANKKLESDGMADNGEAYALIDNFSARENEFSTLVFLNPDYIAPDGTVGKYAAMYKKKTLTKLEFLKVYDAYIEDSLLVFTEKLIKEGIVSRILDKDGEIQLTSEQLNKEVREGVSLEDVIADYYINSKFATIQLLQIFGQDTAFYENSKDLQKRYKEIHAPGEVLNVDAINPYTGEFWNGTRVITDPTTGERKIVANNIQRVVYFNDISVNAETLDPNFMEAVFFQFAQTDTQNKEKAFNEGILVPKDDVKEEKARQAKLKKLLGKNYHIYDKYTKNSLTDGQGYRTLSSYRKVLGMAEKWTPEMENAYNEILAIGNKYGRDMNIPASEVQRIAELAVVFLPLKPYLYTMENLAVNEKDAVKIPVQHKYAEAVLIPELLPANSKLREMAYWMERHRDEDGKPAPIDLVVSTKVVKVGNFGATDINSLEKGYVHQLNYNDYRIQTNVPEHLYDSRLFGTQIRKIIMARINLTKDYSHYLGGKIPRLYKNAKINLLNGKNLISFYNSLIVANILESFNEFSDVIDDIEGLSEIFLQNVINNSRESMDNILAYSLTGDEKFLLPLFEGGLEHDSSALLLSLFRKKVNKLQINGGSAVLVSALGITASEESGDLQYIMDPNDKHNILYAEIEIPFDLSYKDSKGRKIELEYQDWCNEDGTLKRNPSTNTPLIELKFPGILDIVAYRIPTERSYSTINAKIKRFSSKTAGGTIKVPAPGSTTAGFDFDIDKLYFMRYEHKAKPLSQREKKEIWEQIYKNNPDVYHSLLNAREGFRQVLDKITKIFIAFDSTDSKEIAKVLEEKEKLYLYWKEAGLPGDPVQIFQDYLKNHPYEYLDFEEYDYEKVPLDNNRTSRNNMILKLILGRLQDSETLGARLTPGGFYGANTSARIIKELLFGDLTSIEHNGNIDFEALNKRAENLKADPEPNYDPSDPLTLITYNQQNQIAAKLIGIFANHNANHALASLMHRFELNNPILFGEHSLRGLYDLLNGPDGVDVDTNVAEFLAAAVDAVKSPILNFLNLRTLNAGAGVMLARLGYSTTDIGLLFNLPIIKEALDYAENNNVDLQIALKEIEFRYSKGHKFEKGDLRLDRKLDLTSNKLAFQIVKHKRNQENKINSNEDRDFVASLLKALTLFKEIMTVSSEVDDFIAATRFTAANAVGSTQGALFAQLLKVKNYLEAIHDTESKRELTIAINDNFTGNLMISPIDNSLELLSMEDLNYIERLIDNPLAYELAMFDANRKFLELLKKFYPFLTPLYTGVRDRFIELSKYGNLNEQTINDIHRDLMVYILSNKQGSEFCRNDFHLITSEQANLLSKEEQKEFVSSDGDNLIVTNEIYYKKIFPKSLFNTLEDYPELKQFAVFNNMEFLKDKEGKIHINITKASDSVTLTSDDIKRSWAYLHKVDPELSRELFMYSFYKLGFTFGPFSTMQVAPVEVKLDIKVGSFFDVNTMQEEEISYIEYLNKIQNGEININIEDFSRLFILNHLDNKVFVSTPKGTALRNIKELSKDEEGNNKRSFFLPEVSWSSLFKLSKNKEKDSFVPFIKIEDFPGSGTYSIYMAWGEGPKFNKSIDAGITYIRVDALGESNLSLAYGPSMIADNNSPSFSQIEPSSTNPEVTPVIKEEEFDRGLFIEKLVDLAIKTDLKKGDLVVEEVVDRRGQLWAAADMASKEDLENTLREIEEEAKKYGVLDSSGNLIC